MKRKLGAFFALGLLVLLITGCDEVLSVVTVGENGEKVVNNYVSMFSDKVYDESVSMKTWNDIDIFEDEDIAGIMDDLLFKIENKKEKIIVLGDKDAAIEISFFDGGYKYTVFSSMETLNRMFE